MLKKIIILINVMLTILLNFAYADVVPYVGANIGYNGYLFQIKDALNNQTRFTVDGLNGGLFAGYGAVVSHGIYLGGEAFLNGGSLTSATKNINNNSEAKLNSTYSMGLSFIPGYRVTSRTTLYGRIGAVATRFKLTETLTFNNESLLQTFRDYSAQTVVGSQVGLGLQTSITNKVDFRSELAHTNYHPMTTFRGTSFSNNIKPRNNQFNLGFVYKFD